MVLLTVSDASNSSTCYQQAVKQQPIAILAIPSNLWVVPIWYTVRFSGDFEIRPLMMHGRNIYMSEKNRTDKTSSPPSNAIGKILSFIHERRYQPTERLPSERDFAEKFDTSRGAVREALAALESMRVIERRPNSGIYLRNSEESSIEALVLHAESGLPFEPREIAEVMEVRRILEAQATRLACTRRTADNIRDLQAILRDTEKRLNKKLSIEHEDEAFHLAIFAAAKNDILLRIARSFYELSRPRRRIYFSDQGRCRRAYDDHHAILKAIEGRRVGQAEQQINEHLSRTTDAWQTLLGEKNSK